MELAAHTYPYGLQGVYNIWVINPTHSTTPSDNNSAATFQDGPVPCLADGTPVTYTVEPPTPGAWTAPQPAALFVNREEVNDRAYALAMAEQELQEHIAALQWNPPGYPQPGAPQTAVVEGVPQHM